MAKKEGFWRRDWLIALIISIAFLLMGGSSWIAGLERFAYDIGLRASSKEAGKRIAVVAIDDESIANLGRWPWPRDILAEMINRLADGGASVIGNTILLSEPQIDPGLKEINKLIEHFESSGLKASGDELTVLENKLLAPLPSGSTEAKTALPDPARERLNDLIGYYESSGLRNNSADLEKLGELFEESRLILDTDSHLADSMANAGNVVMGMQFNINRKGVAIGKPDKSLPDFVQRNRIENIVSSSKPGSPLAVDTATPPLAILGEATAGVGHLINLRDPDGGVRTELLAVDYYGEVYPSLALMIATRGLNLSPADIRLEPGRAVHLGKLSILTDPISRMYPLFYKGSNQREAFPVDSFFDVYSGKVPVENYKDRIVLIGATAFGVGTSFPTPVSENMSPVLVLAHTVASILNQDFFVVPDWAEMATLGAFLLVALYLIVVLPRLSAGVAAVLSVILLALLIGVNQYLLITEGMWVELMLPSALLVGGYLLLITKRFLVTERGMIRSEEKSAESNRMLGLQFQQQGQLDMALEKFRQCPLDDDMMEPLYNLGLDFERKRQFNKAASVYEYMTRHDSKFRDIQDRIKRSHTLQDTLVIGGSPASANVATLVLDGDSVSKPMLGRYEVEKELGKGAMGIVYQGRDPKINRVVAIKTMALSQEFEADELDEVKKRFFREAETAGRLTHPNIVTIYDAGEELDLAYIAMEFLKGKDLTEYSKPHRLLPPLKAMDMIAQCADALGYAHSQNVVHRDVKPANIMYDSETDKLKITDFGIARITDSSRTKTGVILGTPSFMSPEQLAGKKIDGRSDLFSLTVMLYQLLCGQLPFKGDSMATLMYSIANEQHPDILRIRSELNPCVAAIINKGLQKQVEARYQKGEQMAADLRNCMKVMA
ncbi:MAG: serine/threonine-protein kinase [Gammaproteobacteria bacterium]